MFKKILGLLGLVLLASSSYAQVGLSPGKYEVPFNTIDLTANAGISTAYALAVGTNGTNTITWQTIFSAAPTTITTILEGSTNCSSYSTVDTSTSTAGEIRVVSGSYKCIRFNNTAVTGGAGKTLSVNVVYASGSGNSSNLSNKITLNSSSIPATYGADFIVNGTFTGSATGWTLGGGGGTPDWAYNVNNVTHANGGGTSSLQPSTPLPIVAGKVYLIEFTLSSATAGTLVVFVGGTNCTQTITATNGSFNAICTAINTNNLLFTPSNTLVATIDTISIKSLDTLPQAAFNYQDGTNGTAGWLYARSYNLGLGSYTNYYGDNTGNNYFNTYLGFNAGGRGYKNVGNTFVGTDSGLFISSGTANTVLGYAAARLVSGNSSNNTILGSSAGTPTAIINGNTLVGTNTGNLLVGDNNTCIGSNSCSTGVLSNLTVVGRDIDPTVANTAIIGNASTTDIWFGSAAGASALANTHQKGLVIEATAFGSLGTPSNGTFYYCNDCTVAATCAGGGTGALAKRLNGTWVCN